MNLLESRKFKAIMKEKYLKGKKTPETYLALFAPRESEEDVQIYYKLEDLFRYFVGKEVSVSIDRNKISIEKLKSD